MIARIALAVAALMLVVGCQNDKVDGTSTRRASVEPAKPTMPKLTEPAGKYGGAMKLPEDQTITVKQVVAEPVCYDGDYVRLAGTITNVCPRKGCWFEMKDPDGKSTETLFVKFTDPATGKLIPMEAIGKTVVVEGTVKVREISQEQARHYREEAGASEAELAKIVGPQKQLMLTNPGAQIAGVTN